MDPANHHPSATFDDAYWTLLRPDGRCETVSDQCVALKTSPCASPPPGSAGCGATATTEFTTMQLQACSKQLELYADEFELNDSHTVDGPLAKRPRAAARAAAYDSDEEVMSTMQALPRAPTHAAPPPSLLPAAPAPRHSCTNDAWMHWSSRLAGAVWETNQAQEGDTVEDNIEHYIAEYTRTPAETEE